MITLPTLQKLFPNTPKATLTPYVSILNDKLPAHDITGQKRVACLLAQVGHESAGLTARLENLNYSAAGLLATFPKYFTPAQAKAYTRQPERIANRVYANRMNNGPEASGDGWRFRGKGLIQLTGKANHQAFAKWMSLTLDEAVVYLTTLEGAVMGAVWFWESRGLNALADGGQITAMTKVINGGTNGIDDRKRLWKLALTLL